MFRKYTGKRAFTLAEVLITLGIIGVVAAMTLPTLMTSIEKQSLEVATKKFHSTISNAIRTYMADNNIFNLRASDLCAMDNGSDGTEAQEEVDNFIRKYFNVIKECDRNNADKCFAKKYRSYAGTGQTFSGKDIVWPETSKTFVTVDGTVLSISRGGGQPLHLKVDVNGQNGPNVVGYDLWSMSIFYDGTVDESGVTPEARKAGNVYQIRESRFDACTEGWAYGGCFGHFLNNGYKFDY